MRWKRPRRISQVPQETNCLHSFSRNGQRVKSREKFTMPAKLPHEKQHMNIGKAQEKRLSVTKISTLPGYESQPKQSPRNALQGVQNPIISSKRNKRTVTSISRTGKADGAVPVKLLRTTVPKAAIAPNFKVVRETPIQVQRGRIQNRTTWLAGLFLKNLKLN